MFRANDRLEEARDTLRDAAALAKSLEMRLHSAYCYEALAEVSGLLGQSDEAAAARELAARLPDDGAAFGKLVLRT